VSRSDDEHYPGDRFAAPDHPEYPHNWTPEQRITAYWQGLASGFPSYTSGWNGVLAQAEAQHKRRLPNDAREIT
jgi:hypothetical protein